MLIDASLGMFVYLKLPLIFGMFFLRYLPREVDPLVYNMSHEDPGSVSYSEIGGLSEQIRELREVRKTIA